MPDENQTGIGPYSGAGGRSAPQRLLSKMIAKSRLRSELSAIQMDIDNALHALNPGEIAELQGLLAIEVAAADADIAALRIEAQQEASLAKTTKPVTVRIPRAAATVLAAEVERRCRRGNYPSAESLVGEALAKAFGGSRP